MDVKIDQPKQHKQKAKANMIRIMEVPQCSMMSTLCSGLVSNICSGVFCGQGIFLTGSPVEFLNVLEGRLLNHDLVCSQDIIDIQVVHSIQLELLHIPG